MKTLNYNKIRKKTMTVVLADEEQTTLFVKQPTKGLVDEMLYVKENYGDTTEETVDETAMDELYGMVTDILNNNSNAKHIEKKKIEDLFDFEDIFTLLSYYSEFMEEFSNEKN